MEQEPEAAASAVPLASDVAAAVDPPSQLDVFKNKVWLLCDSNTTDFDAWVSLINAAEETSSDDIDVISLVYHSFLLEFPLCYGYWIKYAAHKARLCTKGDVVEVYEQAVQAVPHSIDLWISYCGFGICAYEDPAHIRSLFERALFLVGKDYLCYHLWDKYIEFENSQKQLVQLATIYISTVKFPTKKLHKYYESFRKLVTLLEQEVTCCVAERLSENIHTSETIDAEDSELDISTIIADLFDQKGGHLRPEALKRYLSVGERLYQRSSKIYKEICCFEASIKRPFFHVKPLDDDQLENWHQYLDYVEKNGDFDWAVKLYERCLIPCASYSEFWIRYAEYVDAKGGREIANYALGRASSCFVKGVPTFCMYYAMFKEQIGDAQAARSLFVKASSNFTSGFYANINRLANMEKRMGNTKAASEIYETAIEDAMQKQNIDILPDLYSNFAQFIYVASRSIGEAKEVFVKGIKRAPCKPLIKGFIQFMSTHGGPTEIPLLDSVISNAVTPGSDVSTALSPEDREDISLLFLEFVDLYGGVKELRKAWARHSKLFPHSTRNISQQYHTTGNSLQENIKRRRTEPLMAAHDHPLEGIRKLKQSSKTDNCSLTVDKEVESQVDRNTAESGKGHRDAEEQKALENVDSHHEASRTAQEHSDMVHSQLSLDESGMQLGMQNQMNSLAKEETNQDLSLREQNDKKANSHQAQSEEAPEAELGDCDSPSKAIVRSIKIDSQDKVIEVSASGHPETVCSKSDSPSGESMPKEGSFSNPARISPELEERQPVKFQVKIDTEHDVSVSNANPERSDDSPNATQCGREVCALGQESRDHVQSSQPQQLAVCAKPSSSELAKTKTNALCFQAQLQHQVANSQTHKSNNLPSAGQNMQQQGLSFTMPQNVQTSSQTQDQLFAQPNQGNQQYLQMMQGYASQMWQYYQQQLYYLQAQHNQQMQSLQQQQLPTEHLQQNFMQQVQQLDQQMVLWQQQVQQQQQQLLQQALPIQQQPDKKLGQYHSSSVDTKHEQNKQQQQASQMDHQSQQLQQQQLLYFQQQQQQMYVMQQQQQQMYQQQHTQQQQLIQQQYLQQQQFLSQMPQQQQDSVQQQQQQLFQQQQQQMVLFQQQQQQFIQKQMQQYLQQQQNQQGPKDQNYKLNPQDGRNRQMEHGQQSETSQSDGSKLRSVEQSELSYPSTPQSQRSNQ
ncbi:pre-mRNA-processing factor 39-2 isoform X2 [Phragmites australis]|uniref:pre-mRNA-processing factor 39-2 isoform X2 n=1 Tax=Phragmites australis TaxID=29695 RepID=UPI002D77BFCF|nr:pre-mRNA-processing factor 39-2 isoform X2 [Phragmites australis]